MTGFREDRITPWIPWGRGALPVLAGLFVLVRVGEEAEWLPGWARWYLDDLLCLPLVLTAVLVVQRVAGRDPGWRLPFSHGLLALFSYGFFFEFLLPRLSSRAVGDPVDLMMYALGLALFEGFLNRRGCGSQETCRSSTGETFTRPAAVRP